MTRELLLGIDVGSTTVKVALVEATTGALLFSDYRRHHAEQTRCLKDLLVQVVERFPDATLKAAACGSGSRPIAQQLGIGFVQEVVANAVAVKRLHPEARTAVELGGQDAKIIFFHHDALTDQLIASDMRMNGVCAGGTGAFIDEIANLLQVPVEGFNDAAERGQQTYHVSGRCGVFAKTDIQPLLNQGVNKADLARSTLHAVARQTVGGLAQGSTITPPVVFEGGPLTFNPYLVRAFAEQLNLDDEQIILPDKPEVIVAYGCALAVSSLLKDSVQATTAAGLLAALAQGDTQPSVEQVPTVQPFFKDKAEEETFLRRHLLPAPPTRLPADRDTLEVYLGIDAGSTTSKFVLLDEQERLVYSFYANNEGQPLEVLRRALIEVREAARAGGIDLCIKGVGTTGYGEQLVAAAFHADHHVVETVAHARAALKFEPAASFVLDIGGQDMKAMFIHDGIITGITLNEACSSGCGAFIETFAQSLAVPVARIAERAFASQSPAQLGSRCTVFMRSKVITEQKNGKTPEDILAGLCQSVIQNVFTKVIRLNTPAALGENIVVQGGTFRNDAILRALEGYAGTEVTRAPYPELMGAIGIALLTKERLTGRTDASIFIGLGGLENFRYQEEAGLRCPFCPNHCNRTVVTFADGRHFVQGNRCERGEIVGEVSDPGIQQRVREVNKRLKSVPNLFKERERLLLKNYPVTPLVEDREVTVGLPLALGSWLRLPFWKGLFRALGFTVRVSGKSDYGQYEKALATIPSDTVCFPAKLAHGHVLGLIKDGVDRIFMPVILNTPAEYAGMDADHPCAVLSGYAAVLKTNIMPGQAVPMDSPTFVWKDTAMRDAQLVDFFRDTFGVAPELTRQAVRAADDCQRTFRDTLLARGAEVLAQVPEDRFAVVLAARPYHGDELVNHGVANVFTGLGVPVLTADALPGLAELDLSHVRAQVSSNVQAQLYAAATLAARDLRLELAQIVSFGCGHDAVVSDQVQAILTAAGKSMLLLKLDESDAKGPLRLRVTSFVTTVQERRKAQPEPPVSRDVPLPRFTKADRKRRTIYIPNLSPGFSRFMEGLVGGDGYRMKTLPLADERAVELGKRFVHNDICFPAQINIGEFLRACEQGEMRGDRIAFGMHQNCKGCRAGQYAALARKALDEAGWADVPIVTTGEDPENLHPGFKLGTVSRLKFVWGLAVLDALEDMLRSTRAYETHPGAAQRTFDEALEDLRTAAPKGIGAKLRVLRRAVAAFNAVVVDTHVKKPVVMVLGEIMVAVHPTSNFQIERYLESQDMEVMTTRLSDFFHKGFLRNLGERASYHPKPALLPTLIDKAGDTLFERARRNVERSLRAYARYRPRPSARELHAEVSEHLALVHSCGEGWLIPGEILHAAARGQHSFVVVQPFGCMPNHVTGRGMIRVVKERYPHVQILPLDFEPDTSLGNIENRLQMLIMNARELEQRLSVDYSQRHEWEAAGGVHASD